MDEGEGGGMGCGMDRWVEGWLGGGMDGWAGNACGCANQRMTSHSIPRE